MSLKLQIEKIKQNWLLVVLLVVIVVALNSVSLVNFGSSFKGGGVMMERSVASFDSAIMPMPGIDFEDEEVERSVTLTASLRNKIKRGSFNSAIESMEALVLSKKGLILNENINTNGEGRKSYLSGSFTIKVPIDDFEMVVQGLNNLGTSESSSRSVDDITKQKTSVESRLQAEKERLERYKQILLEAEDASEKIDVSDRVFNLERNIQYLEESLSRLNRRVVYGTIYWNLIEEKSKLWSFEFIKINEIVKSFINSVNFLIKIIIVVAPWFVVFYIGRKIWKKTTS